MAVLIGLFHAFLMSTKEDKLKLPADVHILFLGNSTIETSVDDKLIPHSFNFAKSAEHIEFAYVKLKMMKRINPQIDTVVVGIDDGILFSRDPKWGRHEINHPYFLTEFDKDDVIANLNYRSWEWNKNYLTSLYDTYKLLFIFTGRVPGRLDMGGYSYLVRDKLKEDVERLAQEASADNPEASSTDRSVEKISPATLHFINKMISFCKQNDITILFMSSPKHKAVWNGRLFPEIYRRYFPSATMYDFTEVVYPDSCYGDTYHLNFRGAEIFSRQLASGFENVRSTVNGE